MKEYLEIGQIVATHGLKGEVKLNPWCDSPNMLLDFDTLYFENGSPVDIVNARVQKSQVILQLSGYETVEDAEVLRNIILYSKREDFDLPKDTYFLVDLMGLEVFDVDSGVKYGVITDILQTGANDVYVVKGDRELLIPAIADVVIETNITENYIKIRPLKGLFDI
ncbi:MAG: ribosome maturation factor RimM [Oscillospiraceae bacterium]|jgi:16S rRNA processing protein RimM|nr:ribosome maturation factor RimM [Oscillospiraceae bacterium]